MIAADKYLALVHGFERLDDRIWWAELWEEGEVQSKDAPLVDLERDDCLAVRLSSESGALLIVLSRDLLDSTPEELETVGGRFSDIISEKLWS